MIEGALWRKWVFYNIPLILFVFVLLFPFYWMIITTFRPDGELYKPWNATSYQPFWTNNPTLEHIQYLFEETSFARWMFNTMFIALASTIISLFCGVLAGYALALLNFPWAGSLGTVIFVTYLVPQTLLFIPLFKMFATFHEWTGIQLLNRWWVLLIVYPTLTVPFCTWIMIGYFASIPKELDEAAIIDGASWVQVLTRIFIPVALPGIIAATIFAFFAIHGGKHAQSRRQVRSADWSVLARTFNPARFRRFVQRSVKIGI